MPPKVNEEGRLEKFFWKGVGKVPISVAVAPSTVWLARPNETLC